MGNAATSGGLKLWNILVRPVELAPKTAHDNLLFIHHNMPRILEKNGLTDEDIADA